MSQVSQRQQMLEELQTAAKEYTSKERTRLKNEAEVLKAILSGRTGGAGIQKLNMEMVSAVAKQSLDAYLNPPK
jgi:hypothetical protein